MTESGYQDREQSEIKHYAIRLYLEAAARILGSAYDFKYVDCCAGPWNSKDGDYRDTSFGIAFSGATLLAAHWLGHSADHILSGDAVHAVLASHVSLKHEHGERYPEADGGFRLDRWRRT